jgi:hypothetical protein
MGVMKALREGLKLIALFGAVAWVVWTMPTPDEMGVAEDPVKVSDDRPISAR